jgi:ribosomal protein L37AE/L43A
VRHGIAPHRILTLERDMKPTVTKLSSVPLTALLCCPRCTCLISYERGKHTIVCHECGATITAPSFESTEPAVHQE